MMPPPVDNARLALSLVAPGSGGVRRRGREDKARDGQSFFEPLGTIHRVSANDSTTKMAKLIAVLVADERATLTTLLEP